MSDRFEQDSHAVERAVAAAPWFTDDATVVVAVSGGADSMALLAALHDLSRRRRLRVIAAHLDHHLREDSHRDRDLVAVFTEAWGIPMVSGDADVAAIARSARASIETAGRRARYAFLEDVAARRGADRIATAHTRSDQVETVMMRLRRGAGERGLAGIPAERGRIVRPFLDVARRDTVDYCGTRGIPFVIDPSNEDRRYARNGVRHDVLPALRRVYPGIDRALLATARSATDALRRARRVTASRLEAAIAHPDADTWTLQADAFRGLDATEAAVLLGDALARIGAHEDAREIHYDTLLVMARPPGLVGSSIDLPAVHVRRDHDALVFHRRASRVDTMQTATASVALAVPGYAALGRWTIRASIENRAGRARGDLTGTRTRAPRTAVELAPEIAHSPLRLRRPRPGDRIRLPGMTGRKKLSDLFIDRKVPHRYRAGLPVVEADGEIIWVAGVAVAGHAVARPEDGSVLRMSVRGTTPEADA